MALLLAWKDLNTRTNWQNSDTLAVLSFFSAGSMLDLVCTVVFWFFHVWVVFVFQCFWEYINSRYLWLLWLCLLTSLCFWAHQLTLDTCWGIGMRHRSAGNQGRNKDQNTHTHTHEETDRKHQGQGKQGEQTKEYELANHGLRRCLPFLIAISQTEWEREVLERIEANGQASCRHGGANNRQG